MQTLRSVIKEDQIRSLLFRATAKASIGAIMLLFPINLPLLLLSIFFIGWGLIPYRKLKKRQSDPYLIRYDDEFLYIDLKESGSTQINIKDIKNIYYRDDKNLWGIELIFNDKTLFLPYFHKRSFNFLKEFIPQTAQDRAS